MPKMRNLVIFTIVLCLVTGCVSVPNNLRLDTASAELSDRLQTQVRVQYDTASMRQLTSTLAEQPLDPATATQLAFLNHPEVFAALAQYGIDQSEYLELTTIPNPLLSWEQFDIDGERVIDAELSTHLKAILWAPKLRRLGQQQLSAQLDELTIRLLALRRRVLANYYGYIADRQRLELHRQIQRATQSRVELAERLRAAGNIPERQLNLERDLLLQSGAQLAQAEQQVERSKRLLALALGNPEADWDTPARLPKLPRQDARGEPAKNLSLLAIDKQTEALRQRLGLERASVGIEELDIGVAGDGHDGDWEVGPLIEVQLPIFHRGEARRLRATQQLSEMTYRRQKIQSELEGALAQTRSDLTFARRMVVQHLDQILPLRRELYQQALADYNAMQMGFFDLALARQRQIEAGLSFIDQLHGYWQADADLKHLGSGGSPADLGGNWVMMSTSENRTTVDQENH